MMWAPKPAIANDSVRTNRI